MGGGVQRLGLRTIAARRVQFPGASEQPRSKHTDQNTGRILSSLCLGWGDPSSVRSAGQAEMPSSYPQHRCGPFAGGGGGPSLEGNQGEMRQPLCVLMSASPEPPGRAEGVLNKAEFFLMPLETRVRKSHPALSRPGETWACRGAAKSRTMMSHQRDLHRTLPVPLAGEGTKRGKALVPFSRGPTSLHLWCDGL